MACSRFIDISNGNGWSFSEYPTDNCKTMQVVVFSLLHWTTYRNSHVLYTSSYIFCGYFSIQCDNSMTIQCWFFRLAPESVAMESFVLVEHLKMDFLPIHASHRKLYQMQYPYSSACNGYRITSTFLLLRIFAQSENRRECVQAIITASIITYTFVFFGSSQAKDVQLDYHSWPRLYDIGDGHIYNNIARKRSLCEKAEYADAI